MATAQSYQDMAPPAYNTISGEDANSKTQATYEKPPEYPGGGYPSGVAAPAPAAGGYQAGTAPGVYAGQPFPPQTRVTVVSNQVPVYLVGGCPACRVGVLQDDFTCLGVCCAIVFFPVGLLFCLLLRERRCSNCGAMFR